MAMSHYFITNCVKLKTRFELVLRVWSQKKWNPIWWRWEL